jgi:hypothetical protein
VLVLRTVLSKGPPHALFLSFTLVGLGDASRVARLGEAAHRLPVLSHSPKQDCLHQSRSLMTNMCFWRVPQYEQCRAFMMSGVRYRVP